MGTAKAVTDDTTRGRPVRRVVVTAVIYLLLGAAVNVAVAWGCASWIPLGRESNYENGGSGIPDGLMWTTSRRTSSTGTRVTSSVYPDIDYGIWDGPSERIIDGHWGRIAYPEVEFNEEVFRFGLFGLSYTMIDEAHGWPMNSLWCSCEYGPHNLNQGQLTIKPDMSGGIWLQENLGAVRFAGFGRALPYIPLWRGFFANTLFYASILFVFIPGPSIARRLIRKRKGCCITCGYDLCGSDSDSCPECGTVAITRSVMA